MENNYKYNHIVNASINYKLDCENIKASAMHVADDRYAVEVIKIFGQPVSWPLTTFKIIDICEYFEKDLINDIKHKLFCNNIWAYCQKHKSMTPWMLSEAKACIREEMGELLTGTYCLSWEVFFDKILNDMGLAGFLSQSIYHNIIAGYFEAITKEYFNIPVAATKYTTPQGTGQIQITFLDESVFKIKTEDFFTGFQFFDELTRETTTENFLSSIKVAIGGALCRQTLI